MPTHSLAGIRPWYFSRFIAIPPAKENDSTHSLHLLKLHLIDDTSNPLHIHLNLIPVFQETLRIHE